MKCKILRQVISIFIFLFLLTLPGATITFLSPLQTPNTETKTIETLSLFAQNETEPSTGSSKEKNNNPKQDDNTKSDVFDPKKEEKDPPVYN